MAKCLVTGGAGFIGSHLVDSLVASGHQVRVFDDLSTGKLENLQKVRDRVELVQGCLSQPDAVRGAVRDQEYVFHLAAIASVQKSVEEPLHAHQINGTGTLHVLEAARAAGVRRLVYAGSSSCYGSLSEGTRVETDLLDPLSPYAASKLTGEHYCRTYSSTYQLETVRVRFFNVFGPRQDPRSPYSGVIALFCSAMARGEQPSIHGDGQQSRDFVYVADAVQALTKAATASGACGKVYNIGTGRAVSILDLVRHVNQLLRADLKPRFGPARVGDVRHSQADIALARNELGYSPQVPFEEGLRRTMGFLS